ncbi:unnamed protein product [Cylicostephanus goldi]|uniref:Rab-GAP TBC domain-containing protein n=1 Tax=Cylicostephanus goldi TaxID=71465 RepID=A0A3P6TTX2_CYLGO|nr:unnamed protein product [Cylicostephanus goldi]
MNVFRGGLQPELRKEAWKYLLEYRKWDETNAQFEKKRAKLAKEYERLKAQWMSISEDQESRFFSYSKRKGLVVVLKSGTFTLLRYCTQARNRSTYASFGRVFSSEGDPGNHYDSCFQRSLDEIKC